MQHDLIRVRHMLAAARDAMEFAADKTRADLEKDRLHMLTIIKSIEIIGEAASKLPIRLRPKIAIFPGMIS